MSDPIVLLHRIARRKAPHRHPVNVLAHDRATTGERVADGMAAAIGS